MFSIFCGIIGVAFGLLVSTIINLKDGQKRTQRELTLLRNAFFGEDGEPYLQNVVGSLEQFRSEFPRKPLLSETQRLDLESINRRS